MPQLLLLDPPSGSSGQRCFGMHSLRRPSSLPTVWGCLLTRGQQPPPFLVRQPGGSLVFTLLLARQLLEDQADCKSSPKHPRAFCLPLAQGSIHYTVCHTTSLHPGPALAALEHQLESIFQKCAVPWAPPQTNYAAISGDRAWASVCLEGPQVVLIRSQS